MNVYISFSCLRTKGINIRNMMKILRYAYEYKNVYFYILNLPLS